MGAEFLDEEDLLAFEYEGAEKLSPLEFARLHKMRPQMVYYYIKQGVIETETCICGRNVVDVQAAIRALQERKKQRRKVL